MEDKDKKKNQEELKKKLHELIDSIEDEHTLSVLNEDIVPYVIENRTKELDEAIAEADRGETISHEEFKKNMSRWLKKIKQEHE